MGFVKKVTADEEYQGESYTLSYFKTSGEIWSSNETGYFEMIDRDGEIVSNGDLTKSGDNLSLTFMIPKADTASIIGIHTIYSHVTHVDDTTFDDIMGVANVIYMEKKPSS